MESPPMRHAWALLLTAAVFLAAGPNPHAAAQSAGADLQGTWKLLICDRLADIEMAIVQVDKAGAAYSAKVVDSMYPNNTQSVDGVSADGKNVTLAIKGGPITG